ncbi:MAG: hypothetical protein AAF227_10225 [Pseudomonadota bacterium]
MDRLISDAPHLPDGEIERAERLIGQIRRKDLTKYNIRGELPYIPPDRRKILVVGQVEDDASLRYGTPCVATNLGLLEQARNENPDACLLWKPHPDIEAGLRAGAVADSELTGLADVVLKDVGAADAIAAADEVWTMTSTLGFEALLRDRPVTCLGMPFYAGRGLTRDLVDRPPHRKKHDVTHAMLAHTCLIGYPRYFDPRTGAPISPETAVALLAEGIEMPPVNKLMAWVRSLI